MMNVKNQRPGDIWIVGDNRYEVTMEPFTTDIGYAIKVEDVGKNPYILYVEVVTDEV